MCIYIIFTAVIIIMSAAVFALFGADKRNASHKRWWRSEAILLLFCLALGGIGGLSGMLFFHHKTEKWRFRILVPLSASIDIIVIVFLLWTSDYYHAGKAAQTAMQASADVRVEKTENGWIFDGPSEEEMLIFYPGAKVEETAYAPLLHMLAEKEMDVCLVKMPLHLAFFGINAADRMVRSGAYSHYYVGGHSLGGAMAAIYAAEHEELIDGEILLAAFPVKESATDTVLIYGSEDSVLNLTRVEKAQGFITGIYDEYVIKGGNHAQFGDYGEQAGDGTAKITQQEQLKQTLEAIKRFLYEKSSVSAASFS